jgi:hypothetical protein
MLWLIIFLICVLEPGMMGFLSSSGPLTAPQMTDVSPNRCGADETLDILVLKAI